MEMKSLTYTSLARLDLADEDLNAIHRSARDNNALDGVTGLLIYNGTHFLQVIEGAEAAIDELIERIRRDKRHSGVEIRDQHRIEKRSFPDWSMELVRVQSDFFSAKDNIARHLPDTAQGPVREQLFRMTEKISTGGTA